MSFIRFIINLLKPYMPKRAYGAAIDRNIKRIRESKMTPEFEKALAELLGVEKGYVDHKADTGGKTNWGVAEAAARRNGYVGSMRDYPLAHAKQVYWKDYWTEKHIRLDLIANEVNAVIASEIFEQGVNTGVVRTCKRVQRVLNVLNRAEDMYPDLKVDGWLGRSTRAAMQVLRKAHDLDDLFRWLNIAQGARYFEILEGDPDQDQEAFARGWAKRVHVQRLQ